MKVTFIKGNTLCPPPTEAIDYLNYLIRASNKGKGHHVLRIIKENNYFYRTGEEFYQVLEFK